MVFKDKIDIIQLDKKHLIIKRLLIQTPFITTNTHCGFQGIVGKEDQAQVT